MLFSTWSSQLPQLLTEIYVAAFESEEAEEKIRKGKVVKHKMTFIILYFFYVRGVWCCQEVKSEKNTKKSRKIKGTCKWNHKMSQWACFRKCCHPDSTVVCSLARVFEKGKWVLMKFDWLSFVRLRGFLEMIYRKRNELLCNLSLTVGKNWIVCVKTAAKFYGFVACLAWHWINSWLDRKIRFIYDK